MDFFLKSGVFGLIIIVGFCLHCLIGALFVLITRSRRVAVLFTAAALLPLIVGMSGSYISSRLIEDAIRQKQVLVKPEKMTFPDDLITWGKQEALIPTYLGAGASVILLGLGVCGIAMTRPREESD